jgi:fructose/tagatose bisphosphate aldolase
MPLVPIFDLVEQATRGGYAVGYFESWDIASLQGVVDAAEAAHAPVILGFNGDFLSRPGRPEPERLDLYAALGRAAAHSARVPCSLIFNECPDDAWTRRAIELGFNLVMPVAGSDPPDIYRRRVAELARLAHVRQIGVEAELGALPHGGKTERGEPTSPEAAAAFVEATGIDLLAVSVGNVHVLTRGNRGLDLDRLEAIRRRVAVPLVLHGGTGIAEPALRGAIARGVAKVNYGTYLKQRYLQAIRKSLAAGEDDPHQRLGLGGRDDLIDAGRRAVREAVLERIGWLGCSGRAKAWM